MLRRLLSLNRNPLQQFTNRRSFATGHDEYVNFWEAPTSPSKWKKEQVVFAVLGGWTVVIYTARKFFSGGKPEQVATPTKAST